MRQPEVVIIAPFWPQPGHVGVHRVDRFVRWLAARGAPVVLVRGGRHDAIARDAWGTTVTVADPLRYFPDRYDVTAPQRPRPAALRRIAALALSPDPSVLWARRVARHPAVLEHGRGAAWVLSSNPPESAHVAASELARRLGARLAIDMRDGWLDEPPRPELQRFRWRRWLEGRMERSILARADRIFVTSPVWRDLLSRRLPFTAYRTTVLTNGYPEPSAWPEPAERPEPRRDRCMLLYAGRLSGSRSGRRLDDLLEPLAMGMAASDVTGVVTLIGEMSPAEELAATHWRARLGKMGWELALEAQVPRATLLQRYGDADGLLVLDPSRAVIPAKLFEYIPARRPIFAVSPADGALAGIVVTLPQGFCAEGADRARAASIAARFLEACVRADHPMEVPEAFTEAALSRRFFEALRLRV